MILRVKRRHLGWNVGCEAAGEWGRGEADVLHAFLTGVAQAIFGDQAGDEPSGGDIERRIGDWAERRREGDGVDGAAFYPEAALRYRAPSLKPPFNLAARRAAGFTAAEIAALPQ